MYIAMGEYVSAGNLGMITEVRKLVFRVDT
jgi:hypothetical protein